MYAGVSVPGDRRLRAAIERLCRYVARPALATERLHERPDGRLEYELQHPWSDGTTEVVLEPRALRYLPITSSTASISSIAAMTRSRSAVPHETPPCYRRLAVRARYGVVPASAFDAANPFGPAGSWIHHWK